VTGRTDKRNELVFDVGVMNELQAALDRYREVVVARATDDDLEGELLAAQEAAPAEFRSAESTLVDAAVRLPVRGLRRAIEHWKDSVDAAAAAREEAERFDRRGLKVTPTEDGMVRVDGNLDPENGQTVISAVQAVMDSWARSSPGARSSSGDARTATQRRADALGEVCRQWLDRSDRPHVAGERPHVTVTVDLDAIEGRSATRCTTDDAGRLSAETDRRIACDAVVSRVITSGRSEPLEVGRRTRVVSPALRRALVTRDGRCRFPGCDRSPSWCDAHHIRHWANGGATDLSNLVLLCRRHHRAIHHGFHVSMECGQPVFRDARGNLLSEPMAVVGSAPP
jgi:hypothetical protein